MRRIVFQIILMVLSLSSQAQKVSNIRAEQRGQDIVILYALETASPSKVSLLLSQDNGASWSAPLKYVSGDVGKNIYGGENQILWKVLEEREQLIGVKIKFKVIANNKAFFESEMVKVEGGSFLMGSNSDYEVHSVTLSSYYIGKYEITQSLWQAIMGYNSSSFIGCYECPVDRVSWEEVQIFIQKLNSKTGKKYRLPSEAEWEFAARGGKMSKGYFYSGGNSVDYIAIYSKNSNGSSHQIGEKYSNELGIYDMSGNVSEWCSDWAERYSYSAANNPKGPSTGELKVWRGGCWEFGEEYCSVAFRGGDKPTLKSTTLGFRLVLPIE